MNRLIGEGQLDPQQQSFLKDLEELSKHTIYINGFPGSGKSVLLVYAIKKIKKNHPDASIIAVVYTYAMSEMFKENLAEIKIDVPVVTVYRFEEYYVGLYDYVICDETQDLTEDMLLLLKHRSKHLITAGDSNQSIFITDVKHNQPVVKSPQRILELLDAKPFELLYIHRLSPSIIAAIQKLLPQMDIFKSKRDEDKHDVQIRLCKAKSEKEEIDYIMRRISKDLSHNYSCAILIPQKNIIIDFCNKVLELYGKTKWEIQLNKYGKTDFGNLNSYMNSQGIHLEYLGNTYGSILSADKNKNALIMTVYSAKGLDFEDVFIPFATSDFYLGPTQMLSKTLLMVAMSRSKSNLFFTYSNSVSDYVKLFKQSCNNVSISDNIINNTNNSQSDIKIDF